MAAFRGWSEAAFAFYRELEAHNDKGFWTAHKHVYDDDVRAPFDALSELVEHDFGPLKVFRPQRDTRFSKDKSPYKTRCYAVTEGQGGEGFYVGISAQELAVGSGYWMMATDQLARYRAAVDDERAGEALAALVAATRKKKLEVDLPGLKTAPRGFPRDHPRIELLRAKSIVVMRHFEPAPWIGTKAAATRITDVWRAAAPLNAWLAEHVGPSELPPDEGRW